MKYRIATTSIAVFLMLSPHNLFAACPNISGPYNWPTCSSSYYVYDLSDAANGCAYSGHSTSTACNWDGYSYDYVAPGYSGGSTYQFTVSGSGGTNWQLIHRVDFTDPNDSIWNYVWIRVTVTRSGSTIYSNMFFSHNGTQGDLSCAQPGVSSFSAQNGDVITIDVGTQALYPNTVIRVSHPFLMRFVC